MDRNGKCTVEDLVSTYEETLVVTAACDMVAAALPFVPVQLRDKVLSAALDGSIDDLFGVADQLRDMLKR